MKKLCFLYPFLIAIAPILFLCAHNSDQVALPVVLIPMAIALAGTGLLLGLSWLALKSIEKASIVTTLLVILFFIYGHWFNILWAAGFFEQSRHIHWLLGALTLIIAATGIFLIARSKWGFAKLAPAATMFATIMLIFSGIKIVSDSRVEVTDSNKKKIIVEQREYPTTAPILKDSPKTPDIYYIILDGYARGDMLKELYDFNNREFLKFLESRGFFVANKSVSNYPMTYMSLASSLNLRYINDVTEQIGKKKKSRDPIYEMIRNHEVGRFLRSKGYRYVHFNTNYGGTETSKIADISYGYSSPVLSSEFITVLFRTTLLRAFEPSVAHLHRFMLEKIKEVPAIEGPTFTLAHFLLPHNPYVFDRDGNVRANVPLDLQWTEKTGGWAAKQQYIDQMIFLNNQMQKIIDHLIEKSPTPPIIILQADHGSATSYPGDDVPRSKWGTFIRERTGILNAYLVPESMKKELYEEITPVNSFRLVLKHQFGADFDPLPDKSYMAWYRTPYDLKDVTDQVLNDSATTRPKSGPTPKPKKKRAATKPATTTVEDELSDNARETRD